VPLLVPTVSHDPPDVVAAVTVKGRLGTVLFSVMLRWTAAEPAGAVILTLVGSGVTVTAVMAFRVTWTFVGIPAPGPVAGVSEIVPTYVPGCVIAAILTPIVRFAGVKAPFGLTVKKLFVEVADTWKKRCAPSALVTPSTWGSTAVEEPTTPLKVRVGEVTTRVPVPCALIVIGTNTAGKPLPEGGVRMREPVVPAGTSCGDGTVTSICEGVVPDAVACTNPTRFEEKLVVKASGVSDFTRTVCETLVCVPAGILKAMAAGEVVNAFPLV